MVPDQVAVMGGRVPLGGEAGDARKADFRRETGRVAGPAHGGGPCPAHAPAERSHRKLFPPLQIPLSRVLHTPLQNALIEAPTPAVHIPQNQVLRTPL